MMKYRNCIGKRAFTRKSSPCLRKFTLIELLIVIAVIAILAAMLMPALSQVKRKAVRVVCMNNMKQNMIGLTMYAKDNRGWLIESDPHSDYGQTVDRFKHLEGSTDYDMRRYLLPYFSGKDYAVAISDNAEDLPTWKCPALTRPAIDHKDNTRNRGCYYTLLYFGRNRFPWCQPLAKSLSSDIESDWTLLPWKLGRMSNFVILQDTYIADRNTGSSVYNHGYGREVGSLSDNPSRGFLQGSQPEGSVLAWGDGSVQWVQSNDLIDVGPRDKHYNNMRVYSLPPR